MTEPALEPGMLEISARAAELAERPSPSWADLAEHAVLTAELGVATETDRSALGRDAGSLSYTAARLGFAARTAECEYFGADEANLSLSALLNELYSSGAADNWLDILWRMPLAMLENADSKPDAPDVASTLAPPGMGHDARRHLADLVVESLLASERGRPWELGSVRKQTLSRCWRFGYYLAACDASLPPGARSEVEALIARVHH